MAIDLLTAMRVYTSIVDCGSFARASDRLDLSRGMTSRYLAQLEDHLGVRLLQRTTRKFSLTEAGEDYYHRAAQILDSVEEAGLSAAQGAVDPRGILRISSATGFSVGHLDRAIIAYLQRYPMVEVDLINSERMVDLVDEGFDLAIRVADQISPGLIARRICPIRICTCASPAYLEAHGSPQIPEDLADHNCLFYSSSTYRNKWSFSRDGETRIVQVKSNFHVNEGLSLVNAALENMGILYEPDFLVYQAIREKRLVPILKEWQADEFSLFAVYPNRQFLPPKVRSFIDFLLEHFGERPYFSIPPNGK